MNSFMDRLANELFPATTDPPLTPASVITFSYLEILGQNVSDCLCSDADTGLAQLVQLGELLDGSVKCRGLSVRPVNTSAELLTLMQTAKEKRLMAATDRNSSSSRSHGVGIVRVAQAGFEPGCGPSDGMLYICDLAGV